MKVYKASDSEFLKYGSVLTGYDYRELFEFLGKTKVTQKGITYLASVPQLEECKVKIEFENRGFGGMPLQLGYVSGKNRVLNCLEYHKSSEFNIAIDDMILVLGCESEIENGVFDTSKCMAFLIPKGSGVELYSTTLHYAPFNRDEAGYRVVCVLPKGTNAKNPDSAIITYEDKMRFGSNKWLMTHADAKKPGAYIGLIGKNITYDDLED